MPGGRKRIIIRRKSRAGPEPTPVPRPRPAPESEKRNPIIESIAERMRKSGRRVGAKKQLEEKEKREGKQ